MPYTNKGEFYYAFWNDVNVERDRAHMLSQYELSGSSIPFYAWANEWCWGCDERYPSEQLFTFVGGRLFDLHTYTIDSYNSTRMISLCCMHANDYIRDYHYQ